MRKGSGTYIFLCLHNPRDVCVREAVQGLECRLATRSMTVHLHTTVAKCPGISAHVPDAEPVP